MKIRIFNSAVLALVVLFAVACSPNKSTTEETDSVVEEEVEEVEDKSKRPSPPATTTANVSGTNVTIDYSSPAVKGRTVFGDLIAYDKVWRTGANEANVFTIDNDITINGESVAAGQYSLFTIPTEGDWTVILNSVVDQWGAYDYDDSQDALRFMVTPQPSDGAVERLMFDVSSAGTVTFAWADLTFSFEVVPASAE
ncbi:MAG: DUF2911 domain-containing protein [Cyclobacteriaceae bacterium]